MRNKLFFAFLAVVLTALISSLLYEYFMARDFEDYVSGNRADNLYWVLASVEGSYADGHWDHRSLHDSIHWAIMLGFDVKVLDSAKKELINSDMALSMLSPSMKRRMKDIEDIKTTAIEFETYPLFLEGREIGTMLVRQINNSISSGRKEVMFRERGRNFLVISFVIAGGGAIILSIFFTLFLSSPLKKMRNAVEAMARRDFSVRLPVVSRDEIGDLSESFNFMAEALEREEALRKRLTSNIAHELRTPLSIMKANAEAVLDGVIEDRARGLDNIRAEIEKLIRLVEGIEDITKAEASFFAKKNYASINLEDFISTIAQKMAPLARVKNMDIDINGPKDIIIDSDPDKLERIVQNVLSNAIDHTEKGKISVNFGAGEIMFFIAIKDTGAGIEDNKLGLIFKRFHHGTGSSGLGLGLAIVRELLEVMGGHIDVQSKTGEGSTFTIWLPKHSNV